MVFVVFPWYSIPSPVLPNINHLQAKKPNMIELKFHNNFPLNTKRNLYTSNKFHMDAIRFYLTLPNFLLSSVISLCLFFCFVPLRQCGLDQPMPAILSLPSFLPLSLSPLRYCFYWVCHSHGHFVLSEALPYFGSTFVAFCMSTG